MQTRMIERYGKRARLFHWLHAAAFVILALTGASMFLPIGIHSGGHAISVLHRAAAVVFVAGSILHAFYDPKKALSFVKETFLWGKHDLKWLIAAPNYYFGGPEEKMPPQGRINTGQKLWQLVAITTGFVFLVTGTLLWFFRSRIDLHEYQWILFAHGIAFVIVFVMFLVHLYMGLFHPRMRESLRSMVDGKVSESYARRHYRRWYDRVIDDKAAEH